MVDEVLTSKQPERNGNQATWREIRRPARQAHIVSDVVAPLLQSFVTGVAALFVAVMPALLFDLPWLLAPTAGAAAFLISWLKLLREVRQQLWEFETVEHQPPPVEAPVIAEGPRTTRLAVTLARQHQERELPIEPDALIRLARACADDGVPFSERELMAAELVTSRSQYEAIRDALVSMSWLIWKSEDRRQGVDWTRPGRAVIRALADGDVTVEDML